MCTPEWNRRNFLVASLGGATLGSTLVANLFSANPFSETEPTRYRVAACDWMMFKRQTLGAIERARECGCDGVEVDMGSLSTQPTFTNQFLSDPSFLDTYVQTCRESGIAMSSMAMSAFYAQPFHERPIERPIRDCIETMVRLQQKVAFLPLGVHGDMVRFPDRRKAIIERLRQVGRWAEDAHVTIGIETSLPAKDERDLLGEIGSDSIRIYYNFQNGLRSGRKIIDELETLGAENIVQIHATNDDGFWLEDDPAIDMPAIRSALDRMKWSGWLVLERSRHRDHGKDVKLNFSKNAAYLKRIFQSPEGTGGMD